MKEKKITIIGTNPFKNHWFDLWEKTKLTKEKKDTCHFCGVEDCKENIVWGSPDCLACEQCRKWEDEHFPEQLTKLNQSP